MTSTLNRYRITCWIATYGFIAFSSTMFLRKLSSMALSTFFPLLKSRLKAFTTLIPWIVSRTVSTSVACAACLFGTSDLDFFSMRETTTRNRIIPTNTIIPIRQSKMRIARQKTNEVRKPPREVTKTTGAAFSTSLKIVVAIAVILPKLFWLK